MQCETCDNQHDGSYGSGRFCNKSCSTKYSKSKCLSIKTKIANCCKCNKQIEINIHSSSKTCRCEDCKQDTLCKWCGQDHCLRPDICKKHQLFKTLNTYFGFDYDTVGTTDLYEEYERVKNLVLSDYYDLELSIPDITSKYNHKNVRNMWKILTSLGLSCRNLSQSQILLLKNGKEFPYSHRYKYGWHTTWENNQVFYRSSYELDYMKILDKQQISYQVESLRILYWDCQTHRERIAIPDFHLLGENLIVEIKSEWTLDIQNMKDKIKSYKLHGYNFQLVLEHKIVNIEEL